MFLERTVRALHRLTAQRQAKVEPKLQVTLFHHPETIDGILRIHF